MRGSSFAIVAALAAGALVVVSTAPGCLDATEVHVIVTTTADCHAGITTSIFTGPAGTKDFGTAPVAETALCGSEEPRIGSLDVVPGGARDGQFDLQVVGAVGVRPSDCAGLIAGSPGAAVPNAQTGCIVARRRVSFRPHKLVNMPVLLSARCIGVPCGADQTCDLGTCTSITNCTEQGCPLDRNVPPGDGTDAAVGDATLDGPPDAATLPSCGPTPEVVVDGQAISGPLAMDGSDFVYANIPTGLPSEIRRIPRGGGQPSTVLAVPSLVAVTASNGSLAWAYDANDTGKLGVTVSRPGVAPAPTGPTPFDPAKKAIAFAGTFVVGIAENSGAAGAHVFAVGSALVSEVAAVAGTADEIVVDDQQDFYAVASGEKVMHYTVTTAGAPTPIGQITPASVVSDIAVANRFLFVAMSLGNANTNGIHRIAGSAVTSTYNGLAWLPGVSPRSMASDGTSLYYLVGTALSRAVITTSGPSPVELGTVDATAAGLQVDDACVYWVENGGTRIMKRAKL